MKNKMDKTGTITNSPTHLEKDMQNNIAQNNFSEMSMFKKLVDLSHEYVNIADPISGKILYANAGLYKQIGYTQEEITSITIFDLDPNLDEVYLKKHMETIWRCQCS